MAEISGLKTINQVVDEFLLKTGRSKEEYYRYEQIALDAIRELRVLHLKGFVKWAKLVISALGTITIPADYLSFVGVCVPVNGQFWFLTEKRNIVITTTGSPETLDSTEGEGVSITDDTITGYYAKGGVNLEGYYKIDERNHRIFINSTDRDDVILLYNSSGINVGSTTYLPVRAIDAIETFVLHKDALYKGDLNMSALYERAYFNSLDRLKYLEAPTFSELKDALYEVISPLASR